MFMQGNIARFGVVAVGVPLAAGGCASIAHNDRTASATSSRASRPSRPRLGRSRLRQRRQLARVPAVQFGDAVPTTGPADDLRHRGHRLHRADQHWSPVHRLGLRRPAAARLRRGADGGGAVPAWYRRDHHHRDQGVGGCADRVDLVRWLRYQLPDACRRCRDPARQQGSGDGAVDRWRSGLGLPRRGQCVPAHAVAAHTVMRAVSLWACSRSTPGNLSAWQMYR
jgi:hypothetical protein